MLNAIKRVWTRIKESKVYKYFVATTVVALPLAAAYLAFNVFLALIANFAVTVGLAVVSCTLIITCIFTAFMWVDDRPIMYYWMIAVTRTLTAVTVFMMIVPLLIPTVIMSSAIVATVKLVSHLV